MPLSTACLEKLEEFVNQEDRIVTYKWFSQKTGISVTSAKQALELFVKHCRSGKVPFTVHTTHLVIGGETKANGQKVTHVCIVDEDQLEAVRSSLKPAGSSHVYSVQKAKIKDSNALYAADVDQRNEKWRSSNKYSSISCPMAVCGKVPVPVAKPQPSKESSSEVKTTAATTSAVGTDDSSVSSLKNEAPAAQATSSKTAAADGKGKAPRGKQPSAASFFGAASTKKTKPKAEPAKEETSTAGAGSAGSAGASAVKSSSPPAATAGKAEVKKEEKAPSKQASFFGERLPKKKPATEEALSTVEKVKDDVKSLEADSTNAVPEKENVQEERKPAAMKRGLAKTKAAETKKRTAKKTKAVDAEPTPVGLDSDLFDAECDSDDDMPVVKASPKTRASPRSKAGKQAGTQAKPDLSNLYDAEDDSDEDSKPAKKPRGRPKKDTKAAAKSKKPLPKSNQPTLKRVRMDDDDDADEEERSEEMPEEAVKAPKPVVPEGPRRKRVKKMVTKTHVNDAGEFVTEKVYETDSTDASDTEAAPVAKRLKIGVPNTPNLAQPSTSATAAAGKTGKKADAKKPAGKGKQSSLTSFFKK